MITRKRKAVIWGVTGQDGSYLSDLLLAEGYEVAGVSRRTSTPNDARVRHLLGVPGFRLLRGDVTDPTSVYRVLDAVEPDEIYNLAAQSHVGVSFDEPRHTTDVTYLGCLNVLEWLRAWHARQSSACVGPRFYQASSSEMFGSAYSRGHFDKDGRKVDGTVTFPDDVLERGVAPKLFQDESTPMMPNSPYAVAKLAAHHAVRVYRESYGIFCCSGILFNHESERRGEEFVTRKVTKYVARLKENGWDPDRPLLLGNWDARRDWGHAEDYVRAMWLMLRHDRPDDFVVATGVQHTVREFVDAAFRSAGFPDWGEYVHAGHPAFTRPCEVPYLCGDASKARREIGWEPRVGFDELVRRMVLFDLEALQQ